MSKIQVATTRIDLNRQDIEALLYTCEVCRRSIICARDGYLFTYEEAISKLTPIRTVDKILESALEQIKESEDRWK